MESTAYLGETHKPWPVGTASKVLAGILTDPLQEHAIYHFTLPFLPDHPGDPFCLFSHLDLFGPKRERITDFLQISM